MSSHQCTGTGALGGGGDGGGGTRLGGMGGAGGIVTRTKSGESNVVLIPAAALSRSMAAKVTHPCNQDEGEKTPDAL